MTVTSQATQGPTSTGGEDSPEPGKVWRWTGREVAILREVQRLSVAAFADQLSVSQRVVWAWERNGSQVTPRLMMQARLDAWLARCTPDQQARFYRASGWLEVPVLGGQRVRDAIDPRVWRYEAMPDAVASRDIATVFRILQRFGVSQRRIAALTGQSQSEISEILAGRQVMFYDVLVRVADGLGIARGRMGLAYCICQESATPAVEGDAAGS